MPSGKAPKTEGLYTEAWARTFQTEYIAYYKRGGTNYKEAPPSIREITFHNVQDLLARFFLQATALGPPIANWRGMCLGITSRTPDGKHVPMFDYDGKDLTRFVSKKARKLQKAYGLGDATLYKTQNGIHLYFLSDRVDELVYMSMLDDSGCCSGFKKATRNSCYGVLRVSAKYTHFDIEFLKVVPSEQPGNSRPGLKGALVNELIRRGQLCGTHLASMYPQWARYQEDSKPWVPPKLRLKSKRVVKIDPEPNKEAPLKAEKEKRMKRLFYWEPL